MDIREIENTVRRIGRELGIEVYDVYKSDTGLVIEQEQFEDTRCALISALIFDQYRDGFDRIEIRVPPSRERKRVRRADVQEQLDHLANLVGTTEDYQN